MRETGDVLQAGSLPSGATAWAARLGTLFLLFLTLAACATAPENPMTAEQRQALHISEISVDLKPGTKIWWGDAERDFAASKGCEQKVQQRTGSAKVGDQPVAKAEAPDCDYEALISSPEAKAYLETRAVEVLENTLARQVQPAFVGSAPAKLSVHIFNVHIVSAGQAMLLGGSHMLQADFDVADLRSGKQLAAYPELLVLAGYGAGGLIALAVEAGSSDPYERLAAEYASSVRAWLKAEKK